MWLTFSLIFTGVDDTHMIESKSPFEEVCNEYAVAFDDSALDIEKTKELISSAKKILIDHDIPAYAPLFYSVGTSLMKVRDDICHHQDQGHLQTDDMICIDKEIFWYLRHAEKLLGQFPFDCESRPYVDAVRRVLYVNLGNAMDTCGRKTVAIDCYSKALSIFPSGMALGNIGKALEHYAVLEGDTGHKAVLIKAAYAYYSQSVTANDPDTYQKAREEFTRRKRKLEEKFGRNFLNECNQFEPIKASTERENNYRQWCLTNHLFLNTLNDLMECNMAFATDSLNITSITIKKSQERPPFVFEMFNQIKEEFIYARYLLYEVENNTDCAIHFADKETHLNDAMNYSYYSIRLEKLKTAYRTLYSLFDRIAFLLNAYLHLNIPERNVSFDKVCKQMGNKEMENIALQALHWIDRDFRVKFSESETELPQTKKLRDLRNALEHKFVSIQMFPVEQELEIGEDFIYRISEIQLKKYTMNLIKLAREAVIELTIAIRIEENLRHGGNQVAIPLDVPEYKDEYKI